MTPVFTNKYFQRFEPEIMPTIILLDNSLSMNQLVKIDGNAEVKRIDLAKRAVNAFLDHQAKHNRLELTSLSVFSKKYQELVPLTHDYATLKDALSAVELKEQSHLITALHEVQKTISIEEWGRNYTCQVIVVTDGNSVVSSSYLNKGCMNIPNLGESESNNWPLPLPFRNKIHIICINTLSNHMLQKSLPFYKEIIARNSHSKVEVSVNTPCEGGQIFVPTVPLLSYSAIEDLTSKLCSEYFKPLTGKITCGNLTCCAYLYPGLSPNSICRDSSNLEVEICGFLKSNEVASPPVNSRHLVVPMAESLEQLKKFMTFLNYKSDLTDEDIAKMFADEAKHPSFGVLLHGGLKIENMTALCQLNDSPTWYGMLYSGTDNKKRSYLMLTTFEPGVDSVSWASKFSIPKILNDLPVAPTIKKPSNYVVWLQPASIQNDVQVRRFELSFV